MKSKGIFVVIFVLLCFNAHATDGVKSPTYCTPNEKVIFSCPFKNGKTVSLCASAELSKDLGTLQYRYGIVGKKPELEFPNEAQKLKAGTRHPSRNFTLFSSTEKTQTSIGNAQIWFEIEDFHYGISAWKDSGLYTLEVYEYQAPADRGTKQIRNEYVCLKNKIVDNLFSLRNIGIRQPTTPRF